MSPGKFCWYELMTTDAKAAETFYRNVVGWDASPFGSSHLDYTVFKAGDEGIAGLMQLPADACAGGARPAWIGSIAVDDVDDMAQRVTKAGGTILHGPSDIEGVGRFVQVADPSGAPFVLFKGNEGGQPSPSRMGTPGYAGWRELVADDGSAAFDFYSGLFGWTKAEAVDMGPMGTYQLFATGEEPVGGMMTKPPGCPAAFWNYYFQVDAIEPAIERLKSGGGSVLNGPHQVPGDAWVVQAMDPQGAMFALVAAKQCGA